MLPKDLTRLTLERTGDDGAVLWVYLSNPAARNAMDEPMQRELIATFRAIANDDTIRCVVVRGEGAMFSSGGDISAFQGMTPEKCYWYATERGEAMQDAVARLDKPLIAAVDGWCLAGGMELLLMADFAYATESAKFGVTEIRIGVLPLWGGVTRLPHAIGLRRAREMLYRGEIIEGPEALHLGLINQYFANADALYAATEKAAQEIAAHSRTAVRTARALIATTSGRADEACMALERGAAIHLAATADAQEGIAAFIEKRPPQFNKQA